MKKILITISIFLLTILNVKANTLSNMDINIVLDEYGKASITEVWKMNNTKDTEVYKKMYNLGNSSISNFKVKDLKQEYILEKDWDINDSFNNKKYKNGYNYVTNGTELCWGISEYGDNTYTISYDVSNYIFNVEDAQVLYWKVIDGMSIMEDMDYNITISGPKEYENTLDVWGYGSKAYVYVENGKIKSENEEDSPMNSESDYLVILVKYPLGTFNTTNTIDEYSTWEEVYNAAEDGTYKYDWYDNVETKSSFEKIFNIIQELVPFIIFLVITIFFAKKSQKYKFGAAGKKIKMKDINAFRDIPCDKDIYKAYVLAKIYGLTKNEKDFIGSIYLKMIFEGNLEIKKDTIQGMFKEKETTSLILKKAPENDIVADKLYSMMGSASENGILETKEFTSYSKANYEEILSWFESAENNGRNKYINESLIEREKSNKYFVNDKLKEEAIKLAGLKKYLIEFASMNQKEAIEVKLWKEYLMYAQIFGIADKVAKQFEKLYPEIISEMNSSDIYVHDIVFLNSFGNSVVHAASAARSAAESYSSGGGGFSSGGGGGGSFGGGGGGTR